MSFNAKLFLFAARCHYVKAQHPGRFDLNFADLSTYRDHDELDPSVPSAPTAPVDVRLDDATLFPLIRADIAAGRYVMLKVDGATLSSGWLLRTRPSRPPAACYVPHDDLCTYLTSVGSIVDTVRTRPNDSAEFFAATKARLDTEHKIPESLPDSTKVQLAIFLTALDLFLIRGGPSDLESQGGLQRDAPFGGRLHPTAKPSAIESESRPVTPSSPLRSPIPRALPTAPRAAGSVHSHAGGCFSTVLAFILGGALTWAYSA